MGVIAACASGLLLSFGIFPNDFEPSLIVAVCAFALIESLAQILDHIFVLEKKPKLTLYKGVLNNSVRLLLVLSAWLITQQVYYMVLALVLLAFLRLVVLLLYVIKIRKFKINVTRSFRGSKPRRH